MTYLSFDLETTSNIAYKRVANPFFNQILCYGYKYKDGRLEAETRDEMSEGWLNGIEVLIGHNIKFDLLYTWKNPELQQYLKDGGRIWCTQLAEYMISAQQYKYPKLRDIAVKKYGCKERVKNIEEGFKKGLDTTNMDPAMLIEDVKNDVLDTEQVALGQLKQMQQSQMYVLAKTQMDALLATTEMEHNGMKVDQKVLQRNKKELEAELEENSEALLNIVREHWEDREFNIGSNQDLSVLFFGGERSFVDKVPNGFFKSGERKGEVKYKNVETVKHINGLGLKPSTEWATKTPGIYSTNEAVLNQLKHPVVDHMLKIREISKQLNTYYMATEELIYPFDSCVHMELCHCGYEKSPDDFGGGTATGRLSSRNPNMQNQPRARNSKVKEHFVSRFEDGYIIDIDFKQLEMVVFAFLTQDINLIKDINSGIDLYKVAGSEVFDIAIDEVTSEQRQLIKGVILAVTYGAGANKISQVLKVDKDFAQKVIDIFYDKYPMTKLWQENLVRQVEASKVLIADKTIKGHLKHMGHYSSVFGRKYQFFTNDAPDFLLKKGILTGFNPPDIKNYIVQGSATADIVLFFLGRLFRKLIHHRDKCLLVNTVHDSIVLDCKSEYKDFACKIVKDEVSCLKASLKEVFDIDFNVKLDVDIKFGLNWRDVK